MGLTQREEGNYITIYGGKFSQRVPQGTPGSVERTNKLGKVVTEKYYDSFTASDGQAQSQQTVGYKPLSHSRASRYPT